MRRNITFRSLLRCIRPIMDIDSNIYHTVIIGNQEWMVENLKTTKYSDRTPIPNISNYNDWFLPSKDELNAMETELGGIENFDIGNVYWSSSEYSATEAYYLEFGTGVPSTLSKNSLWLVCAIRAFISTTNYNIRDIGPAGGWIFWKSGNDYLEAASSVAISYAWSDIINVAIGTTGTAIGTGQANTTAIINQVGHTDSAAKLCADLTSDMLWAADTDGAYCWYDNIIANKNPYGAMYNWFAVNHASKLAVGQFTQGGVPSVGWRVPSKTDFETLIALLGGNAISGGKLKEIGTEHWLDPNTGATDEFGFKIVAGGYRSGDDGLFWNGPDVIFVPFETLGYVSHWSSTDFDAINAYNWWLVNSDIFFNMVSGTKKEGNYVRCVRDVV